MLYAISRADFSAARLNTFHEIIA